jgi:hypothetical protein
LPRAPSRGTARVVGVAPALFGSNWFYYTTEQSLDAWCPVN